MASESSQSSSSSPYLSPFLRTIGNTLKGSFVSVTFKYGIRYEGILDQINDPQDQNSILRLLNVRSFGTEGRKKDGPQIPASDTYTVTLYSEEVILSTFDGKLNHMWFLISMVSFVMILWCVKDLQFKLDPSAQSREEIQSDEEINQFIHSRPNIGYTPSLSSEPLPVPATQHLLTPFSFQPFSANVGSLADVQGTQSASTAVPLRPMMHQAVSPQILDYFASNPSHPNPSPFVEAQFFPQNSNPDALQAVGNDVHHSQSNYPIWPIPYQLAAVTPDPASVIPGQLLTSSESFSGVQTFPQSRQYPYASRDMMNMSQGRFGATNLTSVDDPLQNLATTTQTPWLPSPVSVQQPVYYNRDDFFDTISCNPPLNTQFSECMRQDPEAFGDSFQRGPLPQPGQGEYLVAQTNYRDGDNSNNYSNSGGSGRGRGRNTHF